MAKLICKKCMAVHYNTENEICPQCNSSSPTTYDFKNSDEFLKKEIPRVLDERKEFSLGGLVGDLSFIIINTEPNNQRSAAAELLKYTGFEISEVYEEPQYVTSVLKTKKSADIILRSRKDENPFLEFNKFPKSAHIPNTRLETFVFETKDIEKYVSIQKERGVEFITDAILHTDNYSFIQTIPSTFTGNSFGFIQWKGQKGKYAGNDSEIIDWNLSKPNQDYLKSIKELDHAATRVHAKERDAAIIEFMEFTNYKFEFAVYVKTFNSITNVARLGGANYAMVFTSGISPYVDGQISGPTEKFTHNHGPRVHHLAFNTKNIEDTFLSLKEDGMEFLLDLVGSTEEGLQQTFSNVSKNTLLVNEYIHRYGDFDGFFTKSNVTLLTEATDYQ